MMSLRNSVVSSLSFATVAIVLWATGSQAETSLRSDLPDSYRVQDPTSYLALAALYRNAPEAAAPEDFFFPPTAPTASRWGRRAPSPVLPPNPSKCTLLGRYGETPSQPYSPLFINRVNMPANVGSTGPVIKSAGREFIFMGILSDGSAFDVENAVKLRDTMGWIEKRERDLVVHARQLPGYFNTPVDIYLRKNGDFVSFCLREKNGASTNACEPNPNTSALFSHKELIMYGYCWSASSDPASISGDLNDLSPALALNGSGDEAAFRKVIGRYGNNYYVGRSQYMFTDRNLDLENPVSYTLPADDQGPIKFILASNGNLTIHGYPVYPIDGHVAFNALNAEGKPIRFLDRDTGRVITLPAKAFRFTITESDDSFENRKRRAAEDRISPPGGRFFAITDWSFGHQDIRFYELLPAPAGASYDYALKAFGNFHGDSRPANLDYTHRGSGR